VEHQDQLAHGGFDYSFTALSSRKICAENAKRVATVFKQYRQRFDTTQTFVAGLQHAGTAATALMAEILIQTNPEERSTLLAHLICLKATLALMSHTHQPAVAMSSVVDHFVSEIEGRNIVARDTSAVARTPANTSTLIEASTPTGTSWESPESVDVHACTTAEQARTKLFHGTGQRSAQGHSPQGLPLLPSSWLEDLAAEDTEFLNLMGASGLHDSNTWSLLCNDQDQWHSGSMT